MGCVSAEVVMKRMFLLTWTLCVWLLPLLGLTITKAHYGFSEAGVRNFKQGAWTQSATDLGEGSGKNWSFALPSTGYVNNTYHSVIDDINFPGANIRCDYSQLVNGYGNDGGIFYQDSGEDIVTVGLTGYPNTVYSPPIPFGLPHYLGKTWQGTHSYAYGSYTVNGKVISEGQVSTHLGSFEAVCVRYNYSSSVINYSCYQWETREYGIVAYTVNLNGGMLYVLHQANQNVANADPSLPSVPKRLALSPNPARSFVNIHIEGDRSSVIRGELYNLKGQLILRRDFCAAEIANASLRMDFGNSLNASGIYLLKLYCQNEVLQAKLAVSR